jgi:hypothetical protein
MATASDASAACTFTQSGVVRGHHIYKEVWTPFIGEELCLQQERYNTHDRFAVTLMKGSNIVGRVPREISRAYWKFLEKGGNIKCEVTGKRKLGKGLEVPCIYKFYQGSDSMIEELKKATQKALNKVQ